MSSITDSTCLASLCILFFFFQAEDGIRDLTVTGVQTCALPICKWQVSTTGGIQPRWRADGKELYFIAPDGKLMATSVTASGAQFSAATPQPLFSTRLLATGGAGANKQQYAVSRDGRFLLNEAMESSSAM